MVKQLKNRYNSTAVNRKFVIGVEFGKMKLYDVDQDNQPVMVSANQTSNKQKRDDEDAYYKAISKTARKVGLDWQV